MKKGKKIIISVDCYEFVVEKFNKDLFGEGKGLVNSPKLMSNWWWIYLLAPILGSLLFTGIYYALKQNPDIFWIPFGIGEIFSAWLAIYGIAKITSKNERRNRVFIGIVLILVLFFPLNMATKYREAILSIPVLTSNGLLFMILYSIIFIIICGITVTLTRTQILYSELTKLFGPAIPATLGRFSPDIKTKVDKILEDEIGNYSEHLREYESIRQQAQAIIDSAGVLVLPWITILTILSTFTIFSVFTKNFVELFTSELSILGKVVISLGDTLPLGPLFQLFIIIFGLMATLVIARQVFMNVAIIQSIARLTLKD